jgi:hypothetical protein
MLEDRLLTDSRRLLEDWPGGDNQLQKEGNVKNGEHSNRLFSPFF